MMVVSGVEHLNSLRRRMLWQEQALVPGTGGGECCLGIDLYALLLISLRASCWTRLTRMTRRRRQYRERGERRRRKRRQNQRPRRGKWF